MHYSLVNYYFAPVREQSIVMTVCLSDREHISGSTRSVFTKFCACYLWSCLGPPLAALQYVM